MKLSDVRPNVETSGDMDEKFFSFADEGIIFDILRSKIYSNPILAICREISCNARDAHREVGTPDRPIQIQLPTALEPYYKIKDWGPGISPDRMVNVFIKYTASTKRNDNTQTGGFGLGAKTPLSYADSFTIVTNVDGVQYNYNSFIDPSRVGKLALGSEAPTQEPNGTEIIIPVDPKNFTEFATWTEQACRHWKVKPIIKGGEIHWTKHEPIIEGNNWAITRCHDWNRVAMMVIDGIEYPLPIDTLRKFADAKLIDASRGNFIMYFNVGELSLSATRENIFFDEKTQNLIRARLDGIYHEIKQRANDKIAAFPTLWDANVYYREGLRAGFGDIRFMGKLQWNGIDLHDGHVGTGCTCFHFSKGATRNRKHDPNKLKRSTTQHIAFVEHAALYINDLPLKEPTPRHVRKAFDDDPTLEVVEVLVPNDKVSVQDLETKIHLDKMNPKLLSTITKASARKYTPASSRLLVFKFDSRACNFRQTSYSAMDEDTSDKVLCLLTKENFPNNRQITLSNKNQFDLRSLKYLAEKHPNRSFYGVDASTPADRLEEEFSDLDSLDDFLEEKVTNSGINFVEVKFASTRRSDCDHKMMRYVDKIEPLIKNANSLFLKRLRLHLKVQSLLVGDLHLLDVYESINGAIPEPDIEKFVADNPDFDVEKINAEYEKQYPLLEHLHYYNFEEEVMEPVVHYINIIDQSLEEKS